MKNLLEHFNEIVTEDYCNFVDFLREASPEEIKEVVSKLDDISYKELYNHLDKYTFQIKDEVVQAMDRFIEEFEGHTL